MRILLLLLVLTALVPVGIAGAATLDRARVLPTAVTALDMTNQAVATATAWTRTRCEAVDLWSPDVRGAYRFRAPGPCPATSTGRGIASVSTSYNRVAWLAYAGGNTRDWTLWTASRTAKRPVKLRFASADVDAPAPIVLGNGGEGGIPYAVGADVYEFSDQGARVLTWHAPARVVALAAGSKPGNVAVLLENGHLQVLTTVDKKVHVTDYDYAPGEVRAFRIASVGTVVNTAHDIEIRTGSARKQLGVGPGARLVGFSDGNVVYTRGSEIRNYFRPTGADTLLRHVRAPFFAKFDRRGLAWSTGRTVCFAPRVVVASPISRARGC